MIGREDFLEELAAAAPESAGVISEHLTDNDGLLLHLLTSDLLRMTMSSHAAGDVAATDALMAFMERCLLEGDDDVVNAVAVSFVEDFGTYPGESASLLERWPPTLRAELKR